MEKEDFKQEILKLNLVIDDPQRGLRISNGIGYFLKKDSTRSFLKQLTKFTSFLREDASYQERLFCLFHDIDKTPKCKTCESESQIFKGFRQGYSNYCSMKCMNSDKESLLLRGQKCSVTKSDPKWKEDHPVWNKNLTKEDHPSIAKYGESGSETKRKRWANGEYEHLRKRKSCSEETTQKISKTKRERFKEKHPEKYERNEQLKKEKELRRQKRVLKKKFFDEVQHKKSKLYSSPISDFHFKRYLKFIDERKRRDLPSDVYKEKHHIHPSALGGSNKEINLIYLSAREHFIAHMILHHAFGGSMTTAFFGMCTWISPNQKRYIKLTSKQHADLKKDRSKIESERHKGNTYNKRRMAVNNGEVEYHIYFSDLISYVNKGYKFGGLLRIKDSNYRPKYYLGGRVSDLNKPLQEKYESLNRKPKLSEKNRENYSKAASKTNYDRIGITKDKANKRIKKNDLPQFIQEGWIVGQYREKRRYYTNEKENRILTDEAAIPFLEDGWRLGKVEFKTGHGFK
jgi:hypothetical protein